MHSHEWEAVKKHLAEMRKKGMPADATMAKTPKMPKPPMPQTRGKRERYTALLGELRKQKKPAETHMMAMGKEE